MTNITHREKYDRMNSIFWKRSQVDSKGRTVIPKAVRQKLGLNGNSEILWIQVIKKDGKQNEFIIEVGVQQ